VKATWYEFQSGDRKEACRHLQVLFWLQQLKQHEAHSAVTRCQYRRLDASACSYRPR